MGVFKYMYAQAHNTIILHVRFIDDGVPSKLLGPKITCQEQVAGKIYVSCKRLRSKCQVMDVHQHVRLYLMQRLVRPTVDEHCFSAAWQRSCVLSKHSNKSQAVVTPPWQHQYSMTSAGLWPFPAFPFTHTCQHVIHLWALLARNAP